jgi:hypothetical protein
MVPRSVSHTGFDVERTLRQGRFACKGTLGEGSQGRTFDGVDRREGRPVAIKRFDVRGAKGWKDVELAEREARVLQSLSHSKLPRYVDHFEEDGALYLVMEKIEGESLASMRKRGVMLGEQEVLRLLGDASDVLDYLHSRVPPVVHRDLKPGNVIRRPDGSFAFVDFGAVRDRLRPEGGSTVVGTFGYMAPEQFQGRAIPASDVYAIGATALATLTGREPEQLPHQGLAIRVREALGRGASERLVHVLESMLDPNPDRRATRIAPLLEIRRGDRHRGRKGRRAERLARRIEREARRTSRHRIAWPLALVFNLAFAIGILWIALATQFVVPVVLRILSVFVARRPLLAAADAVRDAGTHTIEGITRSRLWMTRWEDQADHDAGGARGDQEGRVRVDPVPGARARVAVSKDDPEADEEADVDSAERRRDPR